MDSNNPNPNSTSPETNPETTANSTTPPDTAVPAAKNPLANLEAPTNDSASNPAIPVTDNTAEPTPETTDANTSATSESQAENSALLSALESETPAEDPTQTNNLRPKNKAKDASTEPPAGSIVSKKSSKLVPVALAVVAVLGLGGAAGAYYFLFRNQNQPEPESTPQTDEQPQEEKPTANALRLSDNTLSDFDLAFAKQVNQQNMEAKNTVYSPLSLKYALAMLADGANGDSKTQIENLIGDYKPKAYLNSANRSLANGMFINTTFADQVQESYKETLKNKYYADLVLDDFHTPDNLNTWVSDKTLGIITNLFDSTIVNENLNYVLINALAIDMRWNNQLQCADVEKQTERTPCKNYSVRYAHENYKDSVSHISDNNYPTITFHDKEGIEAAKIGLSANRYNIIEELGEDQIRQKVQEEYQNWLTKAKADPNSAATAEEYEKNNTFNLDTYIEELKANYGQIATSTDFAYANNPDELVFVKDLQEYDGSTLQYVAIMPKSAALDTYIATTSAAGLKYKIDQAKDAAQIDNYEPGVVTKLTGHIPFFKFNYEFQLIDNLQLLGITDVFDTSKADLSGMLKISEEVLSGENRPAITGAVHKADINFSNDGIKAAAVTAMFGLGAGGDFSFDYLFDVPVKEIDINFDKPFFFLIRDKVTGETWFAGQVVNL